MDVPDSTCPVLSGCLSTSAEAHSGCDTYGGIERHDAAGEPVTGVIASLSRAPGLSNKAASQHAEVNMHLGALGRRLARHAHDAQRGSGTNHGRVVPHGIPRARAGH